MKSDRLNKVLRDADAGAEFPAPRGQTAQKVWRRAQRRRQARRLGVVGIALVLISAWALWLRPRPAPNLAPIAERPQMPAVAETDTKARLAEMTADLIVAQDQRPRDGILRQVDTLDLVNQDLAESAAILVNSGDRISQRPDGRAEAVEVYRSVLKYFPETPWAGVAAARLRDMKS